MIYHEAMRPTSVRTRPALHEAKDARPRPDAARPGRGRGQKNWPLGRVGLEELTSLEIIVPRGPDVLEMSEA